MWHAAALAERYHACLLLVVEASAADQSGGCVQVPAGATATPAAPAPATLDAVTLEYQTGWGRAFLHYNVDGRGALSGSA